jgi:hypothetical protein
VTAYSAFASSAEFSGAEHGPAEALDEHLVGTRAKAYPRIIHARRAPMARPRMAVRPKTRQPVVPVPKEEDLTRAELSGMNESEPQRRSGEQRLGDHDRGPRHARWRRMRGTKCNAPTTAHKGAARMWND